MTVITTARRVKNAVSNIIVTPIKTTESKVSINKNEFLFYSNSPEKVYEKDLADNGKWLCREMVKGNGQVYTWHENGCSTAITSIILLHNPNNFSVNVTASNIGKSNLTNWQSDILGWQDYFTAGKTYTETIPAGGYTNFFSQVIPSGEGHVFGIVSRLSVTDTNGSPASVQLFDLVYADVNKSGNASSCADRDDESTLRRRGLGAGFYQQINFQPLEIANNDFMGFKLGSKNDFFNGEDLIQIADSSGTAVDNNLFGNYGVQLEVNMTVKNTGAGGNFAVFYGSNGGACFPFVCYNGAFGKPTYGSYYGGIGIKDVDAKAPNGGYSYADILDLGWIEAGASLDKISFFTSLTAMGSSPLVLGIRRI